MVLSPGVRLGPYQVKATLGSGGMGEVYRARDTRLGRDVALKVLPERVANDPARLNRFAYEARAAGSISHPNITAVYDIGEDQGVHYVATELLEGETLRDRMRSGTLTARRAVEYAIQAALGLAAAHDKGVTHRDLKPENLFVTRDGHLKILDFGLAKATSPLPDVSQSSDTAALSPQTDPNGGVGTIGYMSPEQIDGREVDPRSDIFSLGIVLYEMLEGRKPFGGSSDAGVLASVLKDDAEPLVGRAVPQAINNVVLRCLEKRPEDRFHSARDLAFALQAVTWTGVSRSSEVRYIPARQAVRARRWRVAIAGTAAVLLAILGGAWWRAQPRPLDLSHHVPRPLTVDAAWDGEPALSPDGTLVAFTSARSGNADIWLADAGGGQPLQLTSDPATDRTPAWFPSGSRLAFTSDRGGREAIWTIPRLGGTPVLLIPNAKDPAISPDGKRIAFARQGNAGSRIWVGPIDDPAKAQVLTTDADGLWQHERPAWSPDGETIAYQTFHDIWLVPSAGGKARPLLEDEPADTNPTFSADGRSVLFDSLRDGSGAIWQRSLDGKLMQRLTSGAGSERWPSLSRDGHRIAYASAVEEYSLVLKDPESGERSVLPQMRLIDTPMPAPDGRMIAYITHGLGEVTCWVGQVDAGRLKGQAHQVIDHPGWCANPAVSPDGRWLAFISREDGQRDLWAAPLAGGISQRLTDAPGNDVDPAWSPDGTTLAFASERSGRQEVWTGAFAEGQPLGRLRQVTKDADGALMPTWVADGSRIAYLAGPHSDAWITKAEGDIAPSRLTTGARGISLSWDGRRGTLMVLGLWNGSHPAMRSVDPDTGETRPVDAVAPSAPGAVIQDARVSRDGRLLAWVERVVRGEIWLLDLAPEPGQ